MQSSNNKSFFFGDLHFFLLPESPGQVPNPPPTNPAQNTELLNKSKSGFKF